MIKLQFKLPQALISRGFTRRTVFHAPAFQQKGINRLMDINLYSYMELFTIIASTVLGIRQKFLMQKSIESCINEMDMRC